MMLLQEAKPIAEKYKNELSPFCHRVEIAGSIRREKPEVHDIEICCIPKGSALFDFKNYVDQFYSIRGDAIGKYTRRQLPEGIALDLFITTKEKWGLIFAIRTGSAEFSHRLAMRWVELGYKSIDAELYDKNGVKYTFMEERALFDFLKLNYVEPNRREV